MIGRLAIVGLVTAAAGISQANAATLKTWQGGATLTAVNATCNSAVPGFAVGDLAHSVYRAKLAGGEPASALTMLFSRSALSFFQQGTDTQMHGAGSYKGSWISGRATTVSGGAGTAGTYTFTTTPASIVATTPNVTIVGTINNFGGATGCTISFRGAYALRPN